MIGKPANRNTNKQIRQTARVLSRSGALAPPLGEREIVGLSTAEDRPAAATLAPIRDLPAIEAEWTDLCDNAAERNPFYSPWLLTPALAAFDSGEVEIAVVRKGDLLIGLAPVCRARGYARLPVHYFTTWMHEHCYFAAPLVRRGREREFFAALFGAFSGRGAFLRLRHLNADGPLIRAAEEAAAATGRLASFSTAHQRALLKGGYDARLYIDTAIRKKKRKELRRLSSRLAEQGVIEFQTLTGAEELDEWCAQFLTLEAKGWKGKTGTALGCDPSAERFFRAALAAAHRAGVLSFHRLSLARRPIAMIVNFIEAGEGYSFKIAFDEEFSRYSPGVMLEIEMLKAFENSRGLAFIDSCAKADHSMINSLWRDRRSIAALNISGETLAARTVFSVIMRGEAIAESLRAFSARARPAKEGGDADL